MSPALRLAILDTGPHPVRVLLSHENFEALGGTETYILTVATVLLALGHEPMIYSPRRGTAAAVAREQGVAVLARRELPRDCDLVIANDLATASELAASHGDAGRFFVAHSTTFTLQDPPAIAGIADRTIVLNDRLLDSVHARSWTAPVTRLRQPIDLRRFWNLGPVRSQLRTVLVHNRYIGGSRSALLRNAAERAGVELRWLEPVARAGAPEVQIAQADAVIGVGRSALEAMAAGRPTLIYGVAGGDGWVTPDNYPAIEADGFAGLAEAERVFDAEAMVAELRGWDPVTGELGRDLVNAHHHAHDHCRRIVQLARTDGAGPPAAPDPLQELARLTRVAHGATGEAHLARAEATRLRDVLEGEATRLSAEVDGAGGERDQLRAQLAELTAALAASQARYAELVATRRVRAALAVAGRLDRLRRRQRGLR